MSVVLDTSVLIGVETGRVSQDVLPSSGAVSTVTLEELWLGVLMRPQPTDRRRRQTLEAALAAWEALPVDLAVARACAEIRADGRARGTRYQPLDALIGATARVHGLALITQDAGMRGMLGVDVQVV